MVAGKARRDSVHRKGVVPPSVGKLQHLIRLGGETAIRGSTFDTPVIILKATIFIGL